MNSLDLFTLPQLKDWLTASNGPFPSNSDTLFARMVTAASQFARSYLQNNVAPADYTEAYSGTDGNRLMLRQGPVFNVSAVTVNVTSVPPRPQPGAYGYAFDEMSVLLDGIYCGFPRGFRNITVAYSAGYQTSDVVASVTSPVSAPSLSRIWNTDRGVSYTGGAALVKVATAPSAGQYQVTADVSGSVAQYVFAAADLGKSVTITYGYTPEDVVQALIEICSERYKYKERIGLNSQAFGHQQTATFFSAKDLNASAKLMLQPYRRVTPLW